MLNYEPAKALYEELKKKAAAQPDEEFNSFYREFLQAAVDYAENRMAWSFLTQEAQIEDDKARSIKHDANMSLLAAVCRYLGVKGIDRILPDRKTKGDFACYLALFLALEQR